MSFEHPIEKRQGASLPHWTKECGAYHLTFRLADSLPQKVLARIQEEVNSLAKEGRLSGSNPKGARAERIEEYLDRGTGECLLRIPSVAKIVVGALEFHAGTRYELYAYCIMPNHVHAIVQTLPGHKIHQIVHSWKSFTATQINRTLARTGEVWQAEAFDHLMRDARDLGHGIHYVLQNPVSAGLRDWPWVWVHPEWERIIKESFGT